MAKKYWWPTTLALQSLFFQNFQAKIGTYATVLGLTPAQVTAAEGLCDAFLGSLSFVDQSRATMSAATQWRDLVFFGEPVGDPAGASPVFPIGGNPPYTRGVVSQMLELRDLIVALPGYTTVIGEDLGLIGSEILPPPEVDVAPSLKTSVSTGYWVNVSGSMQGMDGMKIEYRPKGGSYTPVAFFTNTPGSFQVSPTTDGEPENGSIRAVFIKKNAEYGEFSPEYPVTVY